MQQNGVKVVCIPQRGGKKTAKRKAYEKSPAFEQGQRFRASIAGRISVLFRGRGMKRCLAEGRQRFELCVGAAVLANNLMRIAALPTKRSSRKQKPRNTLFPRSLFPQWDRTRFPNRSFPCDAESNDCNSLHKCVENQLRLAKSLKFPLRAQLLYQNRSFASTASTKCATLVRVSLKPFTRLVRLSMKRRMESTWAQPMWTKQNQRSCLRILSAITKHRSQLRCQNEKLRN